MPQIFNGKLKSVSFKNLQFIKPFTQFGTYQSTNYRKVLIAGVYKKVGVFIVKFVDCDGYQRYEYSSIAKDLFGGIQNTYRNLIKKGVSKIAFAVIIAPKSVHSKIISRLKEDHLNTPVNNYYQKIILMLTGQQRKKISLAWLRFEKPRYISKDGKEKLNFHDFKGRSGIYLIKEKLIKENKESIVYIGESVGVLRKRLLYKFFRNSQLFYKQVDGIREYEVAIIEIPRLLAPGKKRLKKKALWLEKQLINFFQPRDNLKGKEGFDLKAIRDLRKSGWKPLRGFEGF